MYALLKMPKPLALWIAGLTLNAGLSCGDDLGTRETPVLIYNRTQLEKINCKGHYKLAQPIDLGEYDWVPLCPEVHNKDDYFRGTLLSGGHPLTNLRRNSTDGKSFGFIDQVGSGSLINLIFNNASVVSTGGVRQNVVLGIIKIQGSNNDMTLSATDIEITAKGTDNGRVALFCGIVRPGAANNQMKLIDSHSVHLEGSFGYSSMASVGLAYQRGFNTTLTLTRLHEITLNTTVAFVGALIGYQGRSPDDPRQPRTNFHGLFEEISDLTISANFPAANAFPAVSFLVGHSGFDVQYNNTVKVRAVSGELRFDSHDKPYNSYGAYEALMAGYSLNHDQREGTLLVANPHIVGSNKALVAFRSGDDNCNGTHWDISLNGRSAPGCPGGKGYYSHTAEGWEALWELEKINPDQLWPREQTLRPQGSTEQLLSQQTYNFTLHPNGYYDEQGGFHASGVGPVIWRSLVLSQNGAGITIGKPIAINTDTPDGVFQNSPTNFTLLNIAGNRVQWRSFDLESKKQGEIDSLAFTGNVLAYDKDNLFTSDEDRQLIHHYRLSDKTTVTTHQLETQLSSDARFVVGLDDSLIQAVPHGNQQITLSYVLPDSISSENTVTYSENDFRLLVQADSDNSLQQLVILIPADAQRLSGITVRIQPPEYAWHTFKQELTVNDFTLTYSLLAQTSTSTSTITSTSTSVQASITFMPSHTPSEGTTENSDTGSNDGVVAVVIIGTAALASFLGGVSLAGITALLVARRQGAQRW